MFRLRDFRQVPVANPLTRESYRVNLPLQMAECEANYVRMMKLLAGAKADTYEFQVSRGTSVWRHQLQIIERSRYTTTLVLTQVSPYATSWLKMPRLTVRIYHDARLAEVLAWEGHKRLRPRYEYPNSLMYHSDEKLQLNLFLGEWLNLCLAQGHSLDDIGCISAS